MPTKQPAMTAEEFNAALRKLKLSVYASRRVLGVSLSTAQKYSGGLSPIPMPIARLLKLLQRHGIPDEWRKP
jgi:DNA-binding transcriptional regulator YiaG